jgi:hypothetical protein
VQCRAAGRLACRKSADLSIETDHDDRAEAAGGIPSVVGQIVAERMRRRPVRGPMVIRSASLPSAECAERRLLLASTGRVELFRTERLRS